MLFLLYIFIFYLLNSYYYIYIYFIIFTIYFLKFIYISYVFILMGKKIILPSVDKGTHAPSAIFWRLAALTSIGVRPVRLIPSPCQSPKQYIERLSEYMKSSGKEYKNHAATIRCWANADKKKEKPPARNRDYRVEEGETI